MNRELSRFIEYKNGVEKERPMLTANNKLITIDGIDGVGKSTIAHAVVQKLNEKFGADAAVLVSPSKFNESEGQKRLFGLIREGKMPEHQIDKGVVASFNRAYGETIVPALTEGKIVVVDRSEVDLLRYSIESGDEKSLEERKKYIREGTATHLLWAGNRIFIEANAEDVRDNLSLGGRELSDHDMASIHDVENREEAQKKAEEIVASMPHEGEVNVVQVENKRTDDPLEKERYVAELADTIVGKLIV